MIGHERLHNFLCLDQFLISNVSIVWGGRLVMLIVSFGI